MEVSNLQGPISIKTDYSILNSLIKIDDLISFALNHHLESLGICDDSLSSSREFYLKCLANNIKPIIGLEVIYNEHPMYLYAKNYTGYQNLLKINTYLANLDLITLTKFSNQVICILPSKSYSLYNGLKFFDEVYLGFSNNYEETEARLITENVLSFNIINCLNKEDTVYLKYLNMLGGNVTLSSQNYFTYHESDILTKIISKINIEMPEGKRYIPRYKDTIDSYTFLKTLAIKGLEKRLNQEIPSKYLDRLKYELEVISKMGYVDYFLIVYDYCLYAKKNGCLVGPGRGSAAGSLVCFAIGITDIDPLKYNLMFERFLNPARVTMPDIDIDFDSTKREMIIDYVRNRYGSTHVAAGLTFNTLKTKLVLREVTKLFKVPEDLVSKFLNVVDGNMSLTKNLESEKVKKYLHTYEELDNVYHVALKLENLKKNISTHAAGIVISSVELDTVIPVIKENDHYLTGITMDYLENLGLLKMDFLGLKNLTIISNILDVVGKDTLKNINLEDPTIIKAFRDLKTNGIFQYETYAMKNVLAKLKPNTFSDLVAAVALVRPGPSSFLDNYVKGKLNPQKIVYPDASLKPILKETYGVILYQEQIIAILEVMGGFSKSEADLIRRGISKKKVELINASREKFIQGASKQNIKIEISSKVYDDIVRFSGYGFNKSHSVAYALVGYQMMYLKCFYPVYFINEILQDNKDSNLTDSYLNELKSAGYKISKPNVNLSGTSYTVIENNLMLPLTIIKGINKNISEEIIKNRPYKDYFEFVSKNKNVLNENILSTLIYAGTLRDFETMHTLIEGMDAALTFASLNTLNDSLKPILTKYPDYNLETISAKEIEFYGFYVGNHPASVYQDKNIMKLKYLENNLFKNVLIVVTIEHIKRLKTKKGDDMAFLDVSDETGTCTCMVFKETLKELDEIPLNTLVFIMGKTSKSFDKTRIIVNNISKEKNRKL